MRTELTEKQRIWRDGCMGVVIGDALGCPVQFLSREEVAEEPVKGMRGYGTYDLPPGTWTDDSSLTLALLCSIRDEKSVNLPDIMDRFVRWMDKGEYTPFGESFDIGRGTYMAVRRYQQERDVSSCGGRTEVENGNGSLMRIMPACLYCHNEQAAGRMSGEEAIGTVHAVSGLTHNHMRAKIACGLYYLMARRILTGDGTLRERLQKGIDEGFDFYKKDLASLVELACYGRLYNLKEFADTDRDEIKSSGYVVDTLEAAVWSLLKTNTFKDALLTAVNLGNDTDSVGAVTGGLAGLYYGYEAIPEEWRLAIRKREWIEGLFRDM